MNVQLLETAPLTGDLLLEVLDVMPDAVLCADTAGSLRYINKCGEQLFGFSRREVEGKPIGMLLARTDHPQRAIAFDGLQPGGPPLMLKELLGFTKDDTEFPAEAAVYALEDQDGSVAVITVKNLTEQRRSERLISRLSRAVEQSASTVVITDHQGRIEYVNPKFCELTGYSKEEVLGKTPSIVKSGNTPRETYEELWRTIKSGGVWRGELENKRKDGTLYWESITISPILEEGVVTQFIAVEEDISARKESERLREEYFSKAAQAEKLESLGVMAAGIAHDFNNILMAIIGNADLGMMDVQEHSSAGDRLRQIQKSAGQAAELTDQLLALTGRSLVQKQLLRLPELVEEWLEYLTVDLAPNVSIEHEVHSNLPLCSGDPAQLQQVLYRLISNAVESLQGDSGRITLRTGVAQITEDYAREHALSVDVSSGPYLYLEVEDTGCGIPPEHLAKVFDPFFSTKFVGRGMGLATVQGILHGHGGAVSIHSAPGEGTSVRVYLPCAAEEAAAESAGRSAAPSDWKGAGTVLVADDKEYILSVCRELLQRLGFEVLAVSEGSEVVPTFLEHRAEITAVLLDVTMPEYSVSETVESLLEIDPSLAVLISSGYSKTDAIEQLTSSGQAVFVKKPYQGEELRQVLFEAMGTGRSAVDS